MTADTTWQWPMAELGAATANLILLGIILSLSIFADAVANRMRLPRISLLVVVGVGWRSSSSGDWARPGGDRWMA